MLAVLTSLTRYALAILPRVRHELRLWEDAARAIPDPALREHALAALTDKALNAEATAVFAILTPRAQRASAARLMTAYQVMTDYLDTISELPCPDPLRNSLQLHRALADALLPAGPPVDYYRHQQLRNDGGYLARLIASCRAGFHTLPAAAVVRATAVRAAERCGEGQSYTHAAAHQGTGHFATWAASQERSSGYEWWEIAAGASSSVAVHALLAAAADPHTTSKDAALVDAAYFPPLGALTVLLDDLVDLEDDRLSESHNYFVYYVSSTAAAERLAHIVRRAEEATGALRRRRAHSAILAGVAGFYLSAYETDTPYASPIKARILDNTGAQVRPILAAMRCRRRIASRTSQDLGADDPCRELNGVHRPSRGEAEPQSPSRTSSPRAAPRRRS